MANLIPVNLSVTNAIVTLVHPLFAPGGFDLKASLDAKSAINTSSTDMGTRRRSLDGDVGTGSIYVDYTTEFQFLPDSEAIRLLFAPWNQFQKAMGGASPAAALYITYGARRVQHVFTNGSLMNFNPLASFQEDAQNQAVQIIWADYNSVGV